jgi:transcriptional repressor NrdR
VIKRNGVVEPFSRDKIVLGVRKACQGRPVSDAHLAGLAQRVEEAVRATGSSQIDANEIGLAILPELRKIDLVAYLRFASVYKSFESLDDFDKAILELRAEKVAEATE